MRVDCFWCNPPDDAFLEGACGAVVAHSHHPTGVMEYWLIDRMKADIIPLPFPLSHIPQRRYVLGVIDEPSSYFFQSDDFQEALQEFKRRAKL